MSAFALVNLTCPHCGGTFIENAKLVRPGGQAYCPECQGLFPLDASNDSIRTALQEAKKARARRRERVAQLRERWAEPCTTSKPAPAPRPTPAIAPDRPLLISDVLRSLDALLLRLNEDDRALKDRSA